MEVVWRWRWDPPTHPGRVAACRGSPTLRPPGTRQAPPENLAKLTWEITINSKHKNWEIHVKKKQMYELEHKT